jgi:E3 ubiquitin-protein ligase DOA10
MPAKIPFKTHFTQLFAKCFESSKHFIVNKVLQPRYINIFIIASVCSLLVPILVREKLWMFMVVLDNFFVVNKRSAANPMTLESVQNSFLPKFLLNFLTKGLDNATSRQQWFCIYRVHLFEGIGILIAYLLLLLIVNFVRMWIVPEELEQEEEMEERQRQRLLEFQQAEERRRLIMENRNRFLEQNLDAPEELRRRVIAAELLEELLANPRRNGEPMNDQLVNQHLEQIAQVARQRQWENQQELNEGQDGPFESTLFGILTMVLLIFHEIFILLPFFMARIHLLIFGVAATWLGRFIFQFGYILDDLILLSIDKVFGTQFISQTEFSEILSRPSNYPYTKLLIDYIRSSQPSSLTSAAVYIVIGTIITCLYVRTYIESSFRFTKGTAENNEEDGENAGVNAGELEEAIISVLKQVGDILKIISITGIELIAFPIFCGFLMKLSLIPITSPLGFYDTIMALVADPFAYSWLFWFSGTFYMYLMAKYVTMCRAIMRPGVFYFVRNPQDPNFNVIQEITGKPFFSQIKKIALSGVMYSITICACVGGVVWFLRYGLEVSYLPFTNFPTFHLIRAWGSLYESFWLIIFIQEFHNEWDPSDAITKLWIGVFKRACYRLRLSHFILGKPNSSEERVVRYNGFWAWFNEVQPESNKPIPQEEADKIESGSAAYVEDGFYVRAPSNDRVDNKIKLNLFIPVTKENVRLDGKSDGPNDIHDYTLVYRPSHFWWRVAALLLIIWIVGGAIAFSVTGLPVIVGQFILTLMKNTPEELKANVFRSYLYGLGPVAFFLVCLNKAEEFKNRIRNAGIYIQQASQTNQLNQLIIGVGKLALFLITFFAVLPMLISFTWYVVFIKATTLEWTAFFNKNNMENNIFRALVYSSLLFTMFKNRAMFAGTRVGGMGQALVAEHGYLNIDTQVALKLAGLPTAVLFLMHVVFIFTQRSVKLLAPASGDGAVLADYVYNHIYQFAATVHVLVLGVKMLLSVWRKWKGKVRDDLYLINRELANLEQ